MVERAVRLGDLDRLAAESATSARAASGCSVVTPKLVPASRSRSATSPVNVIAGCMAIVRAPARAAGASTPAPCAPEVCTTSWAGRQAPSSASPATSGPSTSSGTATSTSSARAATSSAGSSGTPGSSRAARSSESGEPPVAATMRCPAAARAAARTLPTRPVPIRPTVSERARCGALMGDPVLEWGTGRGQGKSPPREPPCDLRCPRASPRHRPSPQAASGAARSRPRPGLHRPTPPVVGSASARAAYAAGVAVAVAGGVDGRRVRAGRLLRPRRGAGRPFPHVRARLTAVRRRDRHAAGTGGRGARPARPARPGRRGRGPGRAAGRGRPPRTARTGAGCGCSRSSSDRSDGPG